MSENKINPHDKFFKELFSRKAEVEDFITGFVPKEISSKLNLKDLTLDENSYIDEKLQESFADIVYNCTYSEQKIKIAFLFEHKSYTDNKIHRQLLRYMLNLWDINEKQNKTDTLIPILPIIVYHGNKKWQYKKFYEYFKNLPSEFKPFIPEFDYLIKDLHSADKQIILENYKSAILHAGFLVMKNIFDIFALLNNLNIALQEVYSNEKVHDKRFLISLFYYLYYTNSKDNYVKIKEKVNEIPQTSTDMITIAESFIQQGEEKGIKKGIEKGIKKGIERTACVMLLEDFDINTVERITKLDKSRILELKEEIQKIGADILKRYE